MIATPFLIIDSGQIRIESGDRSTEFGLQTCSFCWALRWFSPVVEPANTFQYFTGLFRNKS